MSDLRASIVEIAMSQEENEDPTEYWLDVGCNPVAMIKARKHWCGAFALWCWHQAGILVGVNWLIGSGLSHSQFGLTLTSDPQPGDLAYFTTNQHYAIVAEASPGMVCLVNGNSRNKDNRVGPTKVVINERPRAVVKSFYSIKAHV